MSEKSILVRKAWWGWWVDASWYPTMRARNRELWRRRMAGQRRVEWEARQASAQRKEPA